MLKKSNTIKAADDRSDVDLESEMGTNCSKNPQNPGEITQNTPVFEENPTEPGDKSGSFDQAKLDAARSLFGARDGVKYQANLEKVVKQVRLWDVTELMGLRSAIDGLLPSSYFSDMDLLEEKRLDLRVLKEHRDTVMNNEQIAENHKTQLISAYNAAFDSYIKLEKDLYTVERVRALERAAIRALDGLSVEVKSEFLRIYQAEYNRLRPDGDS